MNWSQILSANLAMAIREYRQKRSVSSRIFPPFYMSAYVMDAICFCSQFENMVWKWIVQNPLPIHVYHKILWESQFNPHFYKIYHDILLPIHKTIFDRITPSFSMKKLSLTSEFLGALLLHMSSHIMSHTSYWPER